MRVCRTLSTPERAGRQALAVHLQTVEILTKTFIICLTSTNLIYLLSDFFFQNNVCTDDHRLHYVSAFPKILIWCVTCSGCGFCVCSRLHVERGAEEVWGSPLPLQQILDPLRLVHKPGCCGPQRGQDQRRPHAETAAGGADAHTHTRTHTFARLSLCVLTLASIHFTL